MLNVKGASGRSPPLYKGNLAARQTELTIFVFANGKEAFCNQARKFELCKFDLMAWNPTLDAIANRMGLRKNGIKSLYTRGGKRIDGYWELNDGCCYVGVGPHERFRKLNYSDPNSDLFKSKTNARKPTKEVKETIRATVPFYCSTSMPVLSLAREDLEDFHRATANSPFRLSCERNSVRPVAKPSKSVAEIRRIYGGGAQRRRRVTASTVPYYKRAGPEARLRSFTSKYLPYYSRMQRNFLDQTRDKRSLPNAKTPKGVCGPASPLKESPLIVDAPANTPTEISPALTCVRLQQPPEVQPSYFHEMNLEGELLEEWETANTDLSDNDVASDSWEADRNTVECKERPPEITAEGLTSDWPSTCTEHPEETEETQVDYWFMSEGEYFGDESSDELEEGGLKMKFLQLD